MDFSNVIPWRRNSRQVPATRGSDDKLGSPFLALHREMNQLFDNFFRDFDMPLGRFSGIGTWPTVEVSEDDKEVKVCAELPGMEEKDIELSLHEGVLTLKGEKKNETESAAYTERWHGSFARSIPLGTDIDEDNVTANFKNGVLIVTAPKRPEAVSKAKRISIQS